MKKKPNKDLILSKNGVYLRPVGTYNTNPFTKGKQKISIVPLPNNDIKEKDK